jgi:hypothetical protein
VRFLDFLLDPKRLPAWLAVTAALGSGFVLAAGDALLHPLGLIAFREHQREVIGLVFVGACALVALGAVVWLLRRRGDARRMADRVDALDAAEQAVLREFFLQGRNTIAVPVNDLAVAGLLTEGVLAQVGGQMQPTPKGLVAAVRIDPAFRRHLEPDAVGLSSWSPAEAERRRLLQARPAFVGEVARWDAIFQL